MSNLSRLAESTIIFSWTATSLALVSLVVSTGSDLILQRRLALPEWLNFLAFLIGVLLVAQNTWAIIHEGQANHQSDLPAGRIYVLAKSLIVHETLWTIANTLIRTSSAVFLAKMFGMFKMRRVLCMTFLGLSISHGTASVLDLILICRPVSAQWRADVTATCGNQKASFIAIETIAILLDCLICAFPIYCILDMHIAVSKQVQMICVFGIGVLLTVIAALRLRSVSLATSPDFVYSSSYLGLLSALGVMLGIVACTAPSYLRLFNRIRGKGKPREGGPKRSIIQASAQKGHLPCERAANSSLVHVRNGEMLSEASVDVEGQQEEESERGAAQEA